MPSHKEHEIAAALLVWIPVIKAKGDPEKLLVQAGNLTDDEIKVKIKEALENDTLEFQVDDFYLNE